MEKVRSRELREEGLMYCREFLGGSWGKAGKDNFNMVQITGGLSNTLYKCSLKDTYPMSNKEQRSVLLRVYGSIISESSDTVLNDSVTFTLLAERNLGPKLYGVFNKGRLEQYVPSRVLQTTELHHSSISRACARIMCRFHQLHMPMVKLPRWLFDTTQRYLDEVLTLVEKNEYVPLFDLSQEYSQLKELLGSIKSPVVFCHNDLQEGNILFIGEDRMNNGSHLTSDENGHYDNDIHHNGNDEGAYHNGTDDGLHYDQANELLRPIDFEYSSYNFRGFDIGNHFCEWCYNYHHTEAPFFKADLSAYPDKEQQLLFVREYLREKRVIRERNNKIGGGDEVEDDEDEEGLLLEANAFALASHFLWFLWSVVQSKKSTIKFGYMEYSEARMNAYMIQKTAVVQMLHHYNTRKPT